MARHGQAKAIYNAASRPAKTWTDTEFAMMGDVLQLDIERRRNQ